MKRLLLSLLVCSAAFISANSSNDKEVMSRDSFEINMVVPVHIKSDWKWINRYSEEIAGLKKRDLAVKDFTCDVLFVGSSSIRMWTTLQEDMAPLKVVNRGYGGATVRDLLYNYKDVFSKYKPRKIVFYCDNDISGWKDADLTVAQTFDIYRAFMEKVNKDYPGVPVYFLSLKFSKSRWELRDKQRMLNILMEEYASLNPNVTYVEVSSSFVDGNGQIIDEYFREDNLHLSKKGYEVWTSKLKPLLLK